MSGPTWPDGSPRKNTLAEQMMEARIAWSQLWVGFWQAYNWHPLARRMEERCLRWHNEERMALAKFRDDFNRSEER